MRIGLQSAAMASLGLCVISVPAFADGDAKHFAVAPIVEHYEWGGLFVGAGGGFGSIDRSTNVHTKRKKTTEKCKKFDPHDPKKCIEFEKVSSTTTTTDGSSGEDDWRGFGTLQVGYDRLIHDCFLIGAFTDVDWYGDHDHTTNSAFDVDADLDWVWSIGGRFGALVTPRVLLYGVGGYTQASLDSNVAIHSGPSLFHSDDLHGWFVGAGSELRLHKRFSLKLEYRFADYGDENASGSSSSSTKLYDCHPHKCHDLETVTSRSDSELEVQSVRALLVFNLEEPPRVVEPLK
jgi:outer membrane immunogenic protein